MSFFDLAPYISEYENENSMFEIIVKYSGDINEIGSVIGATTEILSENFAILTLRYEQLSLLEQYSEIEAVEIPKILTLNIEKNLERLCVQPVREEERYGLSGEGVLISIIDSGIEYTHPDFQNDDGTSRILYMWDQMAQGVSPQGFKRGAEYDNSQINSALASGNPQYIVPETDFIGHGTAVAGIAAGNGRASGGENTGMAPKASIIVVKLGEKNSPCFARSTEIMRGIKYSIDKARDLKMPIVINISYGTNDGPHNGKSLFEVYINDMAEKWKTSIVVASGNEGAVGHHYSGRIFSNETQNVEFFYSGKNNSFFVTMWKNFVDTFSVEFILPSGKSTGEIVYFDRFRTYRIGNTRIMINYGQPKFYNTFQEIFFQVSAVSGRIPVGIYKIKIRAENVVEGTYDLYLPTVEEVGDDTSFVNPDPNVTLTIPSTAQNVITVGGYDSLRGIIADFSGRGYTLNVVYTKPDLATPAVNVLTTSLGGGYSPVTGTSFAAPFVSGAAALLMEWGITRGNDPFIYGERLKAYLKRGARRSAILEYPNNQWGYGTLCVSDALEELWIFNGYI